jgi:hypothetical protein
MAGPSVPHWIYFISGVKRSGSKAMQLYERKTRWEEDFNIASRAGTI